MIDPEVRAKADALLTAALATSGLADPRDASRERLLALRKTDETAFRRALAYFEDELLPRIVNEAVDPLHEWLEYARLLADLASPGKQVHIDPLGRAAEISGPVPADHLVLHIPSAPKERAAVLRFPIDASPAQRASQRLLVEGSLG